jgi:hypothetical protein
MRFKTFAAAASLTASLIVTMAAGASPALAESHPVLHTSFETDTFSNPNGIAVDESSGDVYVADIGTSTVYKFDASGSPVNFAALGSNALSGAGTPAKAFAFPVAAYGSPAAIALDNSKSASDPSAGDLYVMDAGNGVIDKFSPSGEYVNQIVGFAPNELLGLGVDGNGTVHVDLHTETSQKLLIDEFDGAAANRLIAHQEASPLGGVASLTGRNSGVPESLQADGFAVSATGDDYPIYEPSCSCTVRFGQQLSALGRVDEAGDVAVAVDPATGHLYADDQSSVAEWDTGAMNRNSAGAGSRAKAAGTLVARFDAPELSSSTGQGGIAVDGASGQIYVSNPANRKVYVFASDAPAVTASAVSGVTKEAASLSGTVDPRGVAVSSCEFEYGHTDEFGNGLYDHSVPCKQMPAEIGAGSSPVEVSAQLEGLKPGELYHFRLVASNASGAGEGSGLLATQGVGFGIKSLEVSFLNEDGTPDTQAGSHPYEFRDDFTMNSHFERIESNADSPYVRLPDGILRDVTADLPAGFVGDPNATPKKCTGEELRKGFDSCPSEARVGDLSVRWSEAQPVARGFGSGVYNMVPPRGVALELGTNFFSPLLFINSGVLAGGDYPVEATVVAAPASAPVIESRLTISGVFTPCVHAQPGQGKYKDSACKETDAKSEGEWEKELARRKPFLTMPTGCHGPLHSTIAVDSWEKPGQWVKLSTVTHNVVGAPVSLTGCSKLLFPPTISVSPDTTNASTSSGLTVGVHVPQTAASNPDGLAESALRDTTVTLPEGVTLNPAGADGLEACSEGLAGFTGFSEFNSEFEPGVKTATFTPELPAPLQPGANFCPDGSKIGTVKINTPLLPNPLEGAVYLAAQNANPFGSLVAMYMIVEDPVSGSLVKLTGEVHLSETGQIITTFKNTPDLPFEDLELHFFGGERAPLATPSRCGTYTTQAVFTPWDGNGPVTSTSSFAIDHGPNGGPCPGASLPFNPSLTAGTTSIQAGGFSPFTMTMSRPDGSQNLQAIGLHMPAGLSGLLTGVELCPEPQASEGLCGPNSQIGETIVSVGVGNDPFSVTGGRVYITGPYEGAPFGLSIVNPAKAGPYDLEQDTPCDCVLVRAKIEVDPITTALTVTSDNSGPFKIPTILKGIPLQIQHVNVTINRPGFTFNPTNCNPMAITGALDSTEGAIDALSVPFQATNCARLSFKPQFSVSTSGRTSRQKGASLHIKLVYPKLPFGSQANIASVKVDLPKQLPSRLTTLQKACVDSVFAANPAACPAASRVGTAKAITPLIPVALEGPAYFVSHGGAKFPELIVVLQGYGVTIDLHGETFISKAGITSSTFHTIPDAPVGTFELTLPEGASSALAANGNLCSATRTILVKRRIKVRSKGHTRFVTRKTVSAGLLMPTAFTAQNGAVIHENTPISVTGCGKHKAKKASRHGKRHGRHKK